MEPVAVFSPSLFVTLSLHWEYPIRFAIKGATSFSCQGKSLSPELFILWEGNLLKPGTPYLHLSVSLSLSVTFPPGIVDGQKVSMWNRRQTGQKVDGQNL